MAFSVGDLIKLYRFPTGRRAFAHKQVTARATTAGVAHIAAHATAARDHDRATLRMELARLGVTRSSYGPEAQALDAEVDRALVGLENYFQSQIRVFSEAHPRGQAASALARALFPAGNQTITRLSFVQEHEAVSSLLDRVRDAELLPHVAALPDVTAMIEQLAALNTRYGVALESGVESPTTDEMRAATAEGQERLAQTVALIAAHYATTHDNELALSLIEPILRQNEAIRLARQRRRALLDVDPETGEEQAEGAPAEGTPGDAGGGPPDVTS